VDLSAGMLRQAQSRAERQGLANVKLLKGDARTLTPGALGVPGVNRLHVFLGMSVFPDPEGTLQNLWTLLLPGGRCVLVDVHAQTLGFQGRMVNWMAQADIRRRFWEPLEALAPGRVERVELPSKPLHGGKIFLASATRAA
jgi:ubiquinone/menaquinone biosynthesis C-methylase UbiE